MNQRTLFNDGWEFAKSALDVENPSTLSFHPVDLPHDWLIYNTLDLYEQSVGWYRKAWLHEKSDQRILLYFEGVYMDSTLFVNGQTVGEWKYGYSSFEHDITDALVDGTNEIVMKVVHQSPNSRWYSGAGIYRNVWMKSRGSTYLSTHGVYVSTRRTDNGWTIEIDTQLHSTAPVQLTHTIAQEGQMVASVSQTIYPSDGTSLVDRQTVHVNQPLLWTPSEPNLYQLTSRLSQIGADGEVMDCVSQSLGFRQIDFHPDRGLRINGQPLKLCGVCEHHDLGALGAAFNRDALTRRFRILKEMGVNAIRTAHNMPAPEFMDLADEMGFFVVSEAFDMWERPKTEFDYARFFAAWWKRDIESWVTRDRNHPCLLMWSIGNEIYDTHASDRGQEVTRMLMEEVQRYDPKGNARVTLGSNYMPWENAQKCADIVGVVGYNYAEKYYQPHHEAHPDWIIYGSETASVVQSRGIYHFPFEEPILADDDEQCSALGNSATSWGAKSVEKCIVDDRDAPFSLGQFIWTGFDYIGEPTPYHTKNSYFGQIDTATFKKDSFYVYQSAWTDYKKKPMVHIFPYWDFNEGQTIDVRVCSNAPKIELYENEDLIGTHVTDHAHGTQLVGWWKVPYQPGELKAVAYDETGNVIATDIKRSFGDAKRIRLQADRETVTCNGTDLIFVEISMEDDNGNPVDNANNRVQVEVTGAGRLIGLDNGDSTDYDPYKGRSKRLFSGKLMAIVAATLHPGPIRIEVSSTGLHPAVAHFESLPANPTVSISASASNLDLPCVSGRDDEIPLRKIELHSDSGQVFDASQKEIRVRASLHPSNTSYQEVEWSVVTDKGIPSALASVQATGLEATISALGDGQFRLRCTSKNGRQRTNLISQLEFQAVGIGTAYKDPYRFISAGLYDWSKGDVGNGNERGVATSRDGETHVGFRDIDFGAYGSDTITLPIFALSSEPYAIQIWEGMPGEAGSSLLADAIYQKPSKWNVYQEETYRLSKRLRGVTSVCFVTQQKLHIKGFWFERQNRALTRILATHCDGIYGDSFTKEAHAITGIGNNVWLEFEQLDFADAGVTKLVIFGRSLTDRNTVHIRFSGGDGETTKVVEFHHSEDFMEHVFELEKVVGLNQVTFTFLPGSSFDFGWFQFLR